MAKWLPSTAAWTASATGSAWASSATPTVFAVDDQSARMPALTTSQARWMSYSSRQPDATVTKRVARPPSTWRR